MWTNDVIRNGLVHSAACVLDRVETLSVPNGGGVNPRDITAFAGGVSDAGAGRGAFSIDRARPLWRETGKADYVRRDRRLRSRDTGSAICS